MWTERVYFFCECERISEMEIYSLGFHLFWDQPIIDKYTYILQNRSILKTWQHFSSFQVLKHQKWNGLWYWCKNCSKNLKIFQKNSKISKLTENCLKNWVKIFRKFSLCGKNLQIMGMIQSFNFNLRIMKSYKIFVIPRLLSYAGTKLGGGRCVGWLPPRNRQIEQKVGK